MLNRRQIMQSVVPMTAAAAGIAAIAPVDAHAENHKSFFDKPTQPLVRITYHVNSVQQRRSIHANDGKKRYLVVHTKSYEEHWNHLDRETKDLNYPVEIVVHNYNNTNFVWNTSRYTTKPNSEPGVGYLQC